MLYYLFTKAEDPWKGLCLNTSSLSHLIIEFHEYKTEVKKDSLTFGPAFPVGPLGPLSPRGPYRKDHMKYEKAVSEISPKLITRGYVLFVFVLTLLSYRRSSLSSGSWLPCCPLFVRENNIWNNEKKKKSYY